MNRRGLPSYDQVRQAPREVADFVIPAEFEDENGHMNIRYYLDLAARAVATTFERVGIDDRYRASRGEGFFTAEHHLRYLSEIHVSQSVSVHFRTVARSDRVIHAMAFLLNDSTGQLAYILEVIAPHVDLTLRRVAPFAPDIAAAWDRELARVAELKWDPPVCGVMGIRA